MKIIITCHKFSSTKVQIICTFLDFVHELIDYDGIPTQVGGLLVTPTIGHPLSACWLSSPCRVDLVC